MTRNLAAARFFVAGVVIVLRVVAATLRQGFDNGRIIAEQLNKMGLYKQYWMGICIQPQMPE